MKQDEYGTGATQPADPVQAEPGHPSSEGSWEADRTWGRGAATALEQLRRNDDRTRRIRPDEDRPQSD